MSKGPKPRVTYDGRTYTCRRWNVDLPNLEAMSRTAALVWLMQNTIPTGAGIRTQPKPVLSGLQLIIR